MAYVFFLSVVVDTARWYRETAIVSEDLSIGVGAQFDFT